MSAFKRMVWVALAFGAAAASAQQPKMQIQFAEPIALAAIPGHAEFDAYGRRFELTLQSNDRLLKDIPAARKLELGTVQVVRGSVDNVAGSWVRLTRVGNGVEGAIWDGHDLYVVTRHASIAANLTTPLQVSPDQTVVYRLSDTIHGLPKDFCGLSKHELPSSKAGDDSGLAQYRSLVKELQATATAAPADQLEISLVADNAFQDRYGGLSTDEMLARVNVVDGIFVEQVHVLIVPVDVRLLTNSSALSSNDADTLLDQFADYRNSTPAVRAPGLAHLMTGRDLTGTTVGIAFVDSLCQAREGVSLADSTQSSYFSALVMAHELGHNFGAHHDGAAGFSCAATPPDYLMAPALNGSAQFSQCSLDSIAPVVARARGICIGSAHYVDVAAQFPASPFVADTSAPFSLPLTIKSLGTVSASDVALGIDLPSGLVFQSAVVSVGSCSALNSHVTCALGSMTAGEQRTVELRLAGSVQGNFFVQANVYASNDYITSNNSANVQVGVGSAIDLGVSVAASTDVPFLNDPIDFNIDLSSLRSQPVHGGTVQINLGVFAIDSVVAGPHACAPIPGNPYALRCDLADIAGGSTSRVVVHAHGTQLGIWRVNINGDAPNDGDYSNNYAFTDITVRPEREVRTTVSTEGLNAVLNQAYDITYTVTGAGRLSATNVTFNLEGPIYGVVESLTPSAGTCAAPVVNVRTVCSFGTLAPGDVRTIVVRVRMSAAGTSNMGGFVDFANDGGLGYSSVSTWIYSNFRMDAVAFLGNPPNILEGQTGTGIFGVESDGIDPSQNVVTILNVPAPLRLTHLTIAIAPAGWQCTVLTPQRGSCSGSFADANSRNLLVMYDVTADVPVEADATLIMTADQDGNAANNTASATIRVLPYLDASVSTTTTSKFFPVGVLTPVDLTVTTGSNPVPGAKISANGYAPYFEVAAITINGVSCDLSSSVVFAFGCDVGDLPAHASVPVTVTYRGLQTGGAGTAYIFVNSPNDANRSNDAVQFAFSTIPTSDVALTVAKSSVSGVRGTPIDFPLITATNGANAISNVVVEFTLPTFVSLVSLSSSATCSGNIPVSCTFANMAPGAAGTIAMRLDTQAAGTFTSQITLQAAFDSTPNNNTASVAMTVTAPSTGSGGSSSGGNAGGGGGGRLEWLALLFFTLLCAKRIAVLHPAVGKRRPPH